MITSAHGRDMCSRTIRHLRAPKAAGGSFSWGDDYPFRRRRKFPLPDEIAEPFMTVRGRRDLTTCAKEAKPDADISECKTRKSADRQRGVTSRRDWVNWRESAWLADL